MYIAQYKSRAVFPLCQKVSTMCRNLYYAKIDLYPYQNKFRVIF